MRKVWLTVLVLVLGLVAGFMPVANAGGAGGCDPAVEDCGIEPCDPATEECVPPCDPYYEDCDAEPICDDYGYCWWPVKDPYNSWLEMGYRDRKAFLNDAITDPSYIEIRFCNGKSQFINGSAKRTFKGRGALKNKRIGKVTAYWTYHEAGFSHSTATYGACFY